MLRILQINVPNTWFGRFNKTRLIRTSATALYCLRLDSAHLLQVGEISGEHTVEIIYRVHMSSCGGDVPGVVADARTRLNTGQKASSEPLFRKGKHPAASH